MIDVILHFGEYSQYTERFVEVPRRGDYVRVYGDRWKVVDVEWDIINNRPTLFCEKVSP